VVATHKEFHYAQLDGGKTGSCVFHYRLGKQLCMTEFDGRWSSLSPARIKNSTVVAPFRSESAVTKWLSLLLDPRRVPYRAARAL
jgi:hypothetical protein